MKCPFSRSKSVFVWFLGVFDDLLCSLGFGFPVLYVECFWKVRYCRFLQDLFQIGSHGCCYCLLFQFKIFGMHFALKKQSFLSWWNNRSFGDACLLFFSWILLGFLVRNLCLSLPYLTKCNAFNLLRLRFDEDNPKLEILCFHCICTIFSTISCFTSEFERSSLIFSLEVNSFRFF